MVATDAPAPEVARAKDQLEALCQTLLLPIPILLAVSAALLAGEKSISVGEGKFPADFGLVLSMGATAIILLHCAKLAIGIQRAYRGGDEAGIKAMLQSNPATLNPFFAFPAPPANRNLFERGWDGLTWLFCLIPTLSAGVLIGFSACFLFPVPQSWPNTTAILVALVLSSGITAGSVMTGFTIFTTCLALNAWFRALIFALALLVGGASSFSAAAALQSIELSRPTAAAPQKATTP